MGDFYVDDQFYDHPKALQAGEDAANLYVRGLAWAHRHNTGLIPKSGLDRLSNKKNVTALAANLVAVSLWHDEGDHYRINDWTIRNAKSIAKREQSRNAAKERWRRHSDSNASASIPHSDRNADAMPNQPRNQGTKEPRNQGTSSKSPPPLTVVRDNATAEAVIDEVVEAVARRQLETAANNVRNPSGWLAKAKTTIRTEWAPHILEHHADGVEALTDHIHPPPKPQPAANYLPFHPTTCACNGQGTDRTCNPTEETA